MIIIPNWNLIDSLYSFDPINGTITHKIGKLKGKRAGSLSKRTGYRHTSIKRKTYLEHQIMYYYCTKIWPANQIDHKDLDKTNNKISNLRLCTHSENFQNIEVKKKSKTGEKNITLVNGWYRIYIRGGTKTSGQNKRHYIGRFKNLQDAIVARDNATIRLHGNFART